MNETQLEIPYVRHSRTSKAAAEEIKPRAESLRNRIFDYIMEFGPCTDDKIQRGLRIDGSTERPRRRELEKMGLIEKCDEFGITKSGRHNVAALLGRGMGTVLGDLAESGYDSEWDCLSACEFGAPHTRERVFVVAHTKGRIWKIRLGPRNRRETKCRDRETNTGHWRMEPFSGIRGVASGIPNRVHRLRCLGNAVVPQVAEWIGKQILTALDRAK